MPIKGISDKRRLRRLGRIRLGKKEVNKSGHGDHPVALDHFNFEDAPELVALFGENCKEIDIVLPNEKVDAFFPQERKAYRTMGLFCRGDGETATRVHVGISDGKNSKQVPVGKALDPEGMAFIQDQGLQVQVGDMFELPCTGEECPFTIQKFCKPIGRFLFLVPKAPRVGVYEISTTSYNSIVELNSSIDTVMGIAGRISMIPLKLKLVPKETMVPKTTMKKTIYHLVLEYAGTFASLAEYRNVKEIPLSMLPTRMELDREVPGDLAPQAGRKLEEEVGSAGGEAHPGPDPEPESESIYGVGEIVPEEDVPPEMRAPAKPAPAAPRKPGVPHGVAESEVKTQVNPVKAAPKIAPAVKNELVKNPPSGVKAIVAPTPVKPTPVKPAEAPKPRKNLFA